MSYLKSFNSIIKINENSSQFTENKDGVLQISKVEKYKNIPELIKQLNFFENNNIEVGPNSKGAELIIKLIIAQLEKNGIKIEDTGGEYTTELLNAVKGFQSKKGLEPTGKVDHSTYNVLFGGDPVTKKETEKSQTDPDDVIEAEQYDRIAAKIIDNLEGGYYHPNMMKQNPKRFLKSVYGKSGETMFGLDRHAGHDTYYSTPRPKNRDDVFTNLPYIEKGEYKYKNEDAKDFWTEIDNADAKNKWIYNYRGGELETKLRRLAGKILKPYFNEYFKDFIDKEVQPLIKKDERLLFHFIYAVWNGHLFFEQFAKQINDAYKSGSRDVESLYKVAIESRQNSRASRSAKKMIELFGAPKERLFQFPS